MKHRRHRHVHRFTLDPERRGRGERVQHQLPVRERDAFWQTRRAGRVKDRRARVLVEVRERMGGVAPCDHVLVLPLARESGRKRSRVARPDDLRDAGQLGANRIDDRQEFEIANKDACFRVVETIDELLFGKPHVDGLEDRADHRYGEVTLEITVTVPVHHRDGVTALYSQPAKRAAQPADPLAQHRVAEAPPTVNNLRRGAVRQRREQ